MRQHGPKSVVVALLLTLAVMLGASSASAQSTSTSTPTPITNDGHQINGNIAGTVGLGLLGAEVGLMLPPMFRLHDKWWAWTVFPILGAAGGAVAGALVFNPGDPPPTVTLPLLGAGMVLAIPAVVGALAWKSHNENALMETQARGGGVLDLGARGATFGVPAVASVPVYSAAEQTRYHVSQRTAVRVPLLTGRF